MLNALVQRAATLVAATLVAVALAACGGGGSDTTSPPPLAGNVGPAGATITSADSNATLAIPPGALNSTITVTLTPATDGFMADPQIVPGTVYKLDAPMTGLAQAATLSIVVPDSAFVAAAASNGRAHAQAVVTAPGFFACFKKVVVGNNWLLETGQNIPVGTDLPPEDPNASSFIVCEYSIAVGCPPGFMVDSVSPGTGEEFCRVAPLPMPLLAQLSPSAKAALLPGKYDNFKKTSSSSLNSVIPGFFAVMFDKTPPQISVTTTVTVVAPGMAQIHATFNATDNIGVAQVTLTRGDVSFDNTSGQFTIDSTPLAQFNSPPYVWDSAPMPFNQIFGHWYVMSASDASGNTVKKAFPLDQSTPQISGFTASPSNVPFGGANVTFSWTVPSGSNGFVYPDSISIDNGVGDVSGLTSSAPVFVSTPTTFTLTATNTSDPLNPVTLTTSVTVGVEPAATITTFTATPSTLPAGGGVVQLAWTTTHADTESIDHGAPAISGDSGSVPVNVTTSTDFTLSASNGPNPTAVTKTASVVVATTGDRFVDASNGSDAGGCTQAAPCKTIAKAMTLAPSGSTVYLADGVYAPATQGNGATIIPDGVTLRATNAGAATIADNTVLTVAGSAVLNGIVFGYSNPNTLTCGGVTANSATGTPTLLFSGVLIQCAGAVHIGGNVKATMTPGALPLGVYTAAVPGSLSPMITLSNSADLHVSGGVFDGSGNGGDGGSWIVVQNEATMTLSGVTLSNRTQFGLNISDSASVSLINNTVLDHVGVANGCQGAILVGGSATLSLNQAQISNSPGVAICVANGTTPTTVNVTKGTFAHNLRGIFNPTGGGATAVVTIDQSSFTNHAGDGITWNGFAGTSFTITNSTFTGNGQGGIDFEGTGGSLSLRNSTVSSNIGLGVFIGQSAATGVSADLGTQASPGLNTFTGNTGTGLSVGLFPGQTLQAVGNTWNASQQGADANGHYSTAPNYTPVPKTTQTSGTNWGITRSGVTLDL
jgi:hypothetical protein